MQELTIRLKRLGKKKVHTTNISITGTINTLQDLITACVKSEVNRFNKEREHNHLLPFLTPSEIQEQSKTGKISFGDIHNLDKASFEQSIEIALQGYKDGQFLVFIDDQEIQSLDNPIILSPDSTITFLRMTFLTGTYW